MKTTKKILSIVLAVMLLVGTVVVGVNADTTMVFEKAGSKLVYTATADKAEKDDEGYILVQPGDEITVSVYMQANYYIGTTGSEIFAWSTNFFDTVALSDISKQNFINNYNYPNDKLIAEKAANLGSGYSSGGYVGYLCGRGYKELQPGPFDASTPVLAYQFKFTVASTTADGATAEFLMPEPCSATVATNSRMRQIYAAVNNSATEYGNTSLASQYPETIDLTGTVLKFKVGTAAVEEPCDYTALDAAIAQYETDLEDKALYTSDSWADYEAAYTAAKAVTPNMMQDADGVNQGKIDAAQQNLVNAKAGLDLIEYCSYTALQQAVNNCSELDADEEYYDPTDLATWKAALKTAQDLLAADKLVKSDENQAIIDNAAEALTNAYDELYEIYVDTAPLSQAIAAYKTPEKAPEFYDETKYATYTAALAAAQDGVIDYDGAADTEANRAAVAKLAADLEAAYEALEANYVDTTALSQAVAAYGTTDYTAEYYDATEYATYTDALNTANTALSSLAQAADTAENRAAVAQFAADLKNAFEALDARFVDTAALDKATKDYAAPEYAAEYYDATEYATYTDALAAAIAGVTTYAGKADTQANRDAVAKLAADLKTAFEALDARFVDTAALAKATKDYAAPEYSAEYYDATEYAAWQSALAAANAGVTSYADKADTQANRDAVAKLAADLKTAFEALDARFADTSDLDKATTDYAAPEKSKEYYDAEDYEAWEKALEDAQAGLKEYESKPATEENKAAVEELIEELKNAYEALVPQYIDYSALEEAVKNYGKTPEAADAYKPETYEPYAAALARANEMLANKVEAPASDTVLAAQIQAAADELTATYKALELVPVVTIITDVKCTQQHYKVGDTVKFTYLCSVTGVAKIQLVSENGSTLTYHRTHSAVSVNDNGDGTETWTIGVKIYDDEATIIAKAKVGKIWEDNGFKYQTATSDGEDISIKSAEVLLDGEAVTEFSTNDTVVIKIVAGPNTLRMRLVDQSNGCTSTYSRSKATQDENGNWVWNITRKSAAGEYAYDIHTTGSTNRLSDEGTDLSYTVKAPVVVNGPSTGNDKDIVVSATAKARVIRDNNQTVTVVTDKNAKGVRVVDQYGVVQGYNKDTASVTVNSDGTLVWTITYKCTLAGSYTCEVEALYGSSWMNNDTTVSYTVKY